MTMSSMILQKEMVSHLSETANSGLGGYLVASVFAQNAMIADMFRFCFFLAQSIACSLILTVVGESWHSHKREGTGLLWSSLKRPT